jgi:predicted GIY-YIG superfamily endonuclease
MDTDTFACTGEVEGGILQPQDSNTEKETKHIRHGVIYALINSCGDVIYVGQTINQQARYTQHRATFGAETRMAVLQSRFYMESLSEAERKWIRRYTELGVTLKNTQCIPASTTIDSSTMAFFRATGARGGKLGGKIVAEKMTPEQRSARAKKAVDAREANRNRKKRP